MDSIQSIVAFAIVIGMLLVMVGGIYALLDNKRVLYWCLAISVVIAIFLYKDLTGREWILSLIPPKPTVYVQEISIAGDYLGEVKASSRLDNIKTGNYKLTIIKRPEEYRFELESIYYNSTSITGNLVYEDGVLHFDILGRAIVEEVGNKIIIKSLKNQYEHYELHFSR